MKLLVSDVSVRQLGTRQSSVARLDTRMSHTTRTTRGTTDSLMFSSMSTTRVSPAATVTGKGPHGVTSLEMGTRGVDLRRYMPRFAMTIRDTLFRSNDKSPV